MHREVIIDIGNGDGHLRIKIQNLARLGVCHGIRIPAVEEVSLARGCRKGGKDILALLRSLVRKRGPFAQETRSHKDSAAAGRTCDEVNPARLDEDREQIDVLVPGGDAYVNAVLALLLDLRAEVIDRGVSHPLRILRRPGVVLPACENQMYGIGAGGADIADFHLHRRLGTADRNHLAGHQIARAADRRIAWIQHKVDEMIVLIHRGKQHVNAAVLIQDALSCNTV